MARVIVGMTYQDCDKILADSYKFRIDLLRLSVQQAFAGYSDPDALYTSWRRSFFVRIVAR